MRLPRWADAPTAQNAPGPDGPPPPKPNCVRCRSEQFAWEWQAFGDAKGLMVFCSSCGAVLSWVPRVDSWSI
jgi:hypothetical protein